MSDRLGMMSAIHDLPDDDLPRLAYADWLEERGELAHAEFVRVEVGLSRTEKHSPEYRDLFTRELELIRSHKDEWFGTFRSDWISYELRRGFIEEISSRSPASVLPHADWLHAHHSLQDLRVSGGWRELLPLLRHPLMDILARLTLCGMDMGWSGWHSGPYQRGLPLAKRPLVLALTRHRAGPELVDELLASPRLSRVTWLDLSHNELTPAGVRKLLDGLEAMPRLKTLQLNGTVTESSPRRYSSRDNIGPAGVRALATHPAVGRLDRIDICANHLDGAGVRMLIDSPFLRKVGKLGVGDGLRAEDRRLLRRRFRDRVEMPGEQVRLQPDSGASRQAKA